MSTIVNGLQTAITERASHPTAPVDASLILVRWDRVDLGAAGACTSTHTQHTKRHSLTYSLLLTT